MRRMLRNVLGVWIATAVACLTIAAGGPEEPVRPTATDAKVDISQPGTYRSGQWEYTLLVTSPGSKSEGTLGKLSFGGKPVPEPARGDYYRTPWGDVQWVGNPSTLWGLHGWTLRSPLAPEGRALADPWIEAGGPVVMGLMLRAADNPPPGQNVEPWVQQEIEKLGVKSFRVERAWFPLNDQALTLHDTKMLGTLTVRLAPARAAESLTVLLDGTEAGRVDLPRRDGATGLVRRSLGVVDPQEFYLAFRVERAAPAWPRPLEVSLDSDGKDVVVKGVKEIVISLPGDKRSGRVWVIKSVQGDAPLSSSVQPAGGPQFAPASGAPAGAERAGTFENVFRVTGTGKTYVELAYQRPWEKDQPPEKLFRVTLDVQALPATAPAPAVPLGSIYSTNGQEGLQQVHDGPFVGEATPLAMAFGWAKEFKNLAQDALTPARAGKELALPPAAEGGLWLALHLGFSGGSPPQFLLDSVTFPKAGEIEVTYHPSRAGPMTKDVHAYRVWIPLGRLTPGTYVVRVVSSGKAAVEQKVVVAAQTPGR